MRSGADEDDVLSEPESDDSFDVDVERGRAYGDLDEDDECYPGDADYDCDFALDAAAYEQEPSADLAGLAEP